MNRLLTAIMTSLLLLLSCSKEKEEAIVPQATEKSLFEELKERTLKDPRDAEAWYHLADLYERAEMYREETEALKKVIAITPDRGYAYLKIGTAYNRLGQYQDAVKNLLTAKKYFPKNPLLYNNLAVSYGKLGKIDEEIAALERAISLRPKYATARYNLGVAFLKKGKRTLAQKQYQELLKFDVTVAKALKQEIDRKGK